MKASACCAALLVASVASAAGADEPSGRRHFFTAQVTEYANGPFAKQRVPKGDVAAFPEAFGTSGWKGVHVHLTDAATKGAKPTAAEIRKALDAFARDERIGTDDEAIFFFSGVGFFSRDGAAFCPSGADLKNPDSMILIAELVQRVKLIPCRRKMLVIEACANPIDARVALHQSEPPVGDSVTRPVALKKPGAFVLIEAASEGQYAYNCPNSSYGIATCQLLKALHDPEAAPDGRVTVAALKSYLCRTVPASSTELYAAEQKPVITEVSSIDWVLATVAKPTAKPAAKPAPMPGPSEVAVRPPVQSQPNPRAPTPGPTAGRPAPAPVMSRDHPVLRQAAIQGVRYGLSRIR